MKNLLLPLALSFALSSHGVAAMVQWNNGGDGISWSDSANWLDSDAPDEGDDVVIAAQPTLDPALLGFDPTPSAFTVRSFTFGAGLTGPLEVMPMTDELLQIGAGGVSNLSTFGHQFSARVRAVADSTWSLGPGGLSVGIFLPETYQVTIGSGTLTLGANTVFDINSPSIAGAVLGSVGFGGTLTISLNYLPLATTQWQLFNSNLGDFSQFVVTGAVPMGEAVFDNQVWTIATGEHLLTFDETTGVFSYAAIPEPASVLLFIGAGGIVLLSRRRLRKRFF